MADLSKIILPNNVSYNIKDTVARDTRAALVANTSIPANADLNATTYQKVGSYCCSLSANAPTISNRPTGLDIAFFLTVYSPLAGVDSASTVEGNWIYRIQEIMTYNGATKWVRLNYTNGSGTWSFGGWNRVRFSISDSTSTQSSTIAASSAAVKSAYDLANSAKTTADSAQSTANSALSGVQGGLIYDQTFTISNGVATFSPHVYRAGSEVTTEFAKSCFTWKYRLINGSEVNLTTKDNRGCDVTISQMGYGGHVIGIFNPGT